MINSASASPSLREDRFELTSILRTFHKQQQDLTLVTHDNLQSAFKIFRVEAGRIRLQPLAHSTSYPAELTLVANGHEAKIVFHVDNISWVDTEGITYAVGELSPTFSYIQRRTNLRVPVPVWKKFSLSLHLPGSVERQTFVVENFSIGGLGLLSVGLPNAQIKPGAIFKKVQLDLGEYGVFNLNVEVISLGNREEISIDGQRFTHRISLRFLNLSLITQRNFNKMAYALEVNFNRKR